MTANMRYKLTELTVIAAVIWAVGSHFAPTVSQAMHQSRTEMLVDRLHFVRAKISQYQLEHNGLLPGQQSPGEVCSSEDFTIALMKMSSDGGCYLSEMPVNPFNGSKKVIVGTKMPSWQEAEGAGWFFNCITGRFSALDCAEHTVY